MTTATNTVWQHHGQQCNMQCTFYQKTVISCVNTGLIGWRWTLFTPLFFFFIILVWMVLYTQFSVARAPLFWWFFSLAFRSNHRLDAFGNTNKRKKKAGAKKIKQYISLSSVHVQRLMYSTNFIITAINLALPNRMCTTSNDNIYLYNPEKTQRSTKRTQQTEYKIKNVPSFHQQI